MSATNLLPENPTRFDYLHAIRAVASRSGADEIYHLADAAMQIGDSGAVLRVDRPTPGWNHVGPDHPQTQKALGAIRATPITDAATRWAMDVNGSNDVVDSDTCRDLERQLAEARESLAETQKAWVMAKTERAEAVRERDDARNGCEEQARLLGMSGEREARLIAERNALAKALERTASDFTTFRSIARENGIVGTLGLESLELAATALAAVKGGSHE